MLGAVERGKCLELVERTLLLEHLGIGLDRDRRVEQPGMPFTDSFFATGCGAESVPRK